MREGIREVKETAILIKVLFCNLEFLGRSLVLISPKGSNDYSFFGSSLVFSLRKKGRVQRKVILTNSTFGRVGVNALLSRSSLGHRSVELGKV